MHKDVASILLTEEEIIGRIKQLGKQITQDYKGKDILMVGILRGAVMFYSDLVKNVDLFVEFDFMAVSSYGASTRSSGVVRLVKDLELEIEDKHVIIIEDIVDTGLTLKYLLENLGSRRPLSVKTCCLLDKPSRRKTDIKVDYVGFVVPDAFLIGYGLDYNQKYRNLPYIGILKQELYTT
ncbi:MAG: hypoxanthine phosphoribosyltransferase [Christensenellales bacterium]|jgi:hypoxanthine phosphoribosyltransferase